MSAKRKYPRCYFCNGEIRKLRDGFLELGQQERPPFKERTHVRFIDNGGREERGSLAYPGNGRGLAQSGHWNDWEPVALLTHAHCGPEGLYWINLEQILDSGPESWCAHLATKVWASIVFDQGITWAFGLAESLATKSERDAAERSRAKQDRWWEREREPIPEWTKDFVMKPLVALAGGRSVT